MEARITAHSQPYRLRERIEEAKVRHGQDVRVDLPGVRVTAFAESWFSTITGALFNSAPAPREGEVFFCNMGPLNVRETLSNGDEKPLPNGVILEGLKVTDSGTFDIINALVQSNGDIRLVVDARTRIVPTAREVNSFA
ncbi:MAG TPA: hypothetical protein VFW66_11700 [Gemmatimonadales bacterium]|nr:hypothetical protein [Gemmatimonadales bacterium]